MRRLLESPRPKSPASPGLDGASSFRLGHFISSLHLSVTLLHQSLPHRCPNSAPKCIAPCGPGRFWSRDVRTLSLFCSEPIAPSHSSLSSPCPVMTTKTQGPRHSLPPKVSRDPSPNFDKLRRADVQISRRAEVKPRRGADIVVSHYRVRCTLFSPWYRPRRPSVTPSAGSVRTRWQLLLEIAAISTRLRPRCRPFQ